jgi:hypothetical protein
MADLVLLFTALLSGRWHTTHAKCVRTGAGCQMDSVVSKGTRAVRSERNRLESAAFVSTTQIMEA